MITSSRKRIAIGMILIASIPIGLGMAFIISGPASDLDIAIIILSFGIALLLTAFITLFVNVRDQ